MTNSHIIPAPQNPENRWREVILISLFFILSPFLCTPLLVVCFCNGKRYARILLAVFLALCSIYYPPLGDQLRYHIYVSEVFPILYWENYWDSVISVKHFSPVMIFFWAGAQYSLSLGFMRFLLVLTGFLVALHVLDDITDNNQTLRTSPSANVYAGICVLCSVPFFPLIWGIRQGLASILVAAGVYFLFISPHRALKGVVLLLIGGVVHFSLSPLIPLLLIIRFVPILNLRKCLPAPLLIVLAACSSLILSYVVDLSWFEDLYGSSLQEQYLDNSNMDHLSGARSLSLAEQLVYLYPLLFCLYLIVLFYRFPAKSRIGTNAMLVLLLFSCLYMRDFFLRYRISMLIAPAFVFYLLTLYDDKIFSSRLLQQMATLSFFIFFIGNFMHCYQAFGSGEFMRIFYSSLPQMLLFQY